MIPKVIEAHYAQEFTIHLRFSDGTEGDVDLSQELYGELFEPLKDTANFTAFTIHPEFQTLCWQNGADLAPEFLYEKIQASAYQTHGETTPKPAQSMVAESDHS
jgi:hypothetical protein